MSLTFNLAKIENSAFYQKNAQPAVEQNTLHWPYGNFVTGARLCNCIIITSNYYFKEQNNNKKDGYRQQNVRQRQKLISIIDYDVCMTFY